MLLLFAVALILLERGSRGRARFTQTARRGPAVAPAPLSGWRGAAATAAAGGVLALAFVVPVLQLLWWAAAAVGDRSVAADFARLAGRSALAAAAAALVCGLAVLLGYAGRRHGTAAVRISTRIAASGYALPGALIAVGASSCRWRRSIARSRRCSTARGAPPAGLLLTGSAAGLLLAYVVRFLAVGQQTVEASLARVSPSLDDAARSLGARAGAALRLIHLPMIRGGVLTAFVLVFVETVKEMPATLLLRPAGLDTLSVEIWERTSEAMWREAALPALALVAIGLVSAILLVRVSSRR